MSDCSLAGRGITTPIVAPQTVDVTTQTPSLSEISPGDKPWDKHRSFADRVEGHYNGSEFQDYSNRIQDCSQLLSFGLTLQEDTTMKLKLRAARFCRVRHCPVCQWRRSLMWKAKAYKVLPKIVETYPKYRWLFLTLTQKNVNIKFLRETLTDMNTGFKRMSKLKAFPAIGWLRSTEVTRGRDGNAHPHFHCLLLVPTSYFGNNYLSKTKWIEMWQNSMRLDYKPILDIQAVKQGDTPMDLVPELLKYCTKESDMVADREWFLELTHQMHKMRSIATGGVLKDYLRELEQESDDLIGEDGLAEDEFGRLYFGWKRQDSKYRMVNHS
jgi:plasmid rolling circle replication initiator protein Rep